MSNLTEQVPGTFMEVLTRTNRKIRDDRALEIAEGAKVHYRREVEDLELALSQLQRQRRSMLDLSPTTADSLVLASDFDAGAFVKKDIELGVKIRETEIKLGIARDAYNSLFGGETPVPVEEAPTHG